MGRPPCCDKVGIKKGPWTPEEDIILVSYIQQHGPGNWRAVPTNTGLMRCSKSCRLRWTNYLRPGIKRGNFTPHEEGMIIHLQALLGNKWAAIASYLPQRTDNDIKNYWNTHLKKKLKKSRHSSMEDHSNPQDHQPSSDNNSTSDYIHQYALKNNHEINQERGVIQYTKNINHSPSYASSEQNISRLLQGWMIRSSSSSNLDQNDHINREIAKIPSDKFGDHPNCSSLIQCYRSQHEIHDHDQFKPLVKSSCGSGEKGSAGSEVADQEKVNDNVNIIDPPYSVLEKWLMDESVSQVELPPMF